MKDDLTPCDTCENALFNFNGDDFIFTRCACPMKDKKGRCNCLDARRFRDKLGGSL